MYAEKLQLLFEKAKGNADIEQDIMDGIQNILNYVERTIQEGMMLQHYALYHDVEDYQTYAEKVWAARNYLHDKACESIDILNAMSEVYTGRKIVPEFRLETFDNSERSTNNKYNTCKYSSNCHMKAALFCGAFINELFLDYQFQLSPYIMDDVARASDQTNIRYTIDSFQSAYQMIDRYVEKHKENQLEEINKVTDASWVKINTYDNVVIDVYVGNKNNICSRNKDHTILMTDVTVHGAKLSRGVLGDATGLIDVHTGKGHDIPMSAIRDICEQNGGIRSIEKCLDLELKQESQLSNFSSKRDAKHKEDIYL